MSDRYKLNADGTTERVEGDLLGWANAFELSDNHIALDKDDKFYISTIFLGLDYSHGLGAPQLFETMVFNQPMDGKDIECERYATKEQALKGHKEFVEKYMFPKDNSKEGE